MTFYDTTNILIHKNIKIIIKKPMFILSHVLTLILVCSVVYSLNYLTQISYKSSPDIIYPVEEVTNI